MGTTNPRLIALYSPVPQSGKSEVAKVLMCEGYRRIKFADPLKSMLRPLLADFGYTAQEIEDRLEGPAKELPIEGLNGATPRFLMEELGSTWGRQTVHAELWTRVARNRINWSPDPVVVDDMRFPNEYRMLSEMGATFVRVAPRAGVAINRTNPNEAQLEDYTFNVRLSNEGTAGELRMNARRELLRD